MVLARGLLAALLVGNTAAWSVTPPAQSTKPGCSYEGLRAGLDAPIELPPKFSHRQVEEALKTVSPEDLPSAGIVLKAGEAFDRRYNLAGDHLFLIVNPTGQPGAEIMVYSRLVPEDLARKVEAENTTTPLQLFASHRALFEKLAQETGIPRRTLRSGVLSAGRFRRVGGFLSEVGNTGEGFKSSQEQLEYASKVLQARGQQAKSLKLLSADPGEIARRQARRRILSSKDLVEMSEGIQMVHTAILNKYPTPTGELDYDLSQLKAAQNHFVSNLHELESVSDPATRRAVDRRITGFIDLVGNAAQSGYDEAVIRFCRTRSPEVCHAEYIEMEHDIIRAIARYPPGRTFK